MADVGDLALIVAVSTGFAVAATVNKSVADIQAHRKATGRSQPPRIAAGRRAPDRTQGTVFVLLGALAFVIGFVVMGLPGLANAWLQGAGACAAFMSGSVLVTRGRRMRAIPAEQVLADDARPPIVYLRPFAVDRVGRASVARSVSLERTNEQRLARAMRDIGPLVALGDPSEPHPELGAARTYADDERWREAVAGLTDTAGTIVVHVGDSPGLAWELQHLVELSRPQRVVLATQALGDRRIPSVAAARYNAFRAKYEHLFPRGLPDEIGAYGLLFFEADWTPCTYSAATAGRAATSSAQRDRVLVGLAHAQAGTLGRLLHRA